MHQPIPEQGAWLAQVVRGFFAYHAVPTNFPALSAFYHIKRLWLRTLRRRSQKDVHMGADYGWPTTFFRNPILHPWPNAALPSSPKVGAVCVNPARAALCGGRSVTTVPTALRDEYFAFWPKCMVRPCVARRFRRICGGGLASMYPASDWSVLCSGPSWISAHVRSH